MSVLGAIVLPHPPLIVPQVGRGSERTIQQTTDSCRQAAAWLASLPADTLVVISPHSPAGRDHIPLSPGAGAKGSLAQFGAPEAFFEISYDEKMTGLIEETAGREGLVLRARGGSTAALDHGVLVPLHFLSEAAGGRLPWRFVRVGLSGLSYEAHYRLGTVIQSAAEKLGRRICIVASGDLSHYLKEDGPYGFRREGPRYDAQVMDILSRAAFGELLRMPEAFCAGAGECGQRSFLIMAGCLDGLGVHAHCLSYQDVTGVGYGVCTFEPLGEDGNRRFLRPSPQDEMPPAASGDAFVALARKAYEHFVRSRCPLARPEGLPGEMLHQRAGVFVSLKKNGALRGCIGTISPTTACIADEIMQNAVSAAAYDPRFSPVTAAELPDMTCSVDVLGEAEEVDSPNALDVKTYGVIVSRGGRRGLLLPNLEGVETVEEQVAIARRKAGILPGERVALQRFEVVRHT